MRTRDSCLAHAHTYSRFNPLDVDRECERGSSSRLSFSRMLERKRIEDQHAKRRKDPEQPTPHQRLKASHGCSGRTCSRFSLVWCSLREQAEGPRPALPSVGTITSPFGRLSSTTLSSFLSIPFLVGTKDFPTLRKRMGERERERNVVDERIATEGSGYQAWELTNQLMTLEVIHRSS